MDSSERKGSVGIRQLSEDFLTGKINKETFDRMYKQALSTARSPADAAELVIGAGQPDFAVDRTEELENLACLVLLDEIPNEANPAIMSIAELDCSRILNDSRLLGSLRRRFVKYVYEYAPDLDQIDGIFPITSTAFIFLLGLDDTDILSRIGPLPSLHAARSPRVVLFDTAINSARTMYRTMFASDYLGWDIVGMWTIVYNDLAVASSPAKERLVRYLNMDGHGSTATPRSREFLWIYTGSQLHENLPPGYPQDHTQSQDRVIQKLDHLYPVPNDT